MTYGAPFLALAIAVAGIASVGRSVAEVECVIGNYESFSNNRGPSTTIDIRNGKSMAFTLGDASFRLSEVQLVFQFPKDGAQPNVEVWLATAEGAPVDLLEGLANPSIAKSSGPEVYIFTPKNAVELKAHQTYAIVVRNDSEIPLRWTCGDDQPIAPAGDYAQSLSARYGPAEQPEKWNKISENYDWMQVSGERIEAKAK